MSAALSELLSIMARLRAADGCPWDREQTFASVAPYTIEEAYEVAAAIESGNLQDLKDELGDLLLQVVFHAQMASEAGHFDFDAVAAGINQKLVRRHPHIFTSAGAAPGSAREQLGVWEEIKAQERRSAASRAPSHVDGVPQALPALMRAEKLSKRAALAGFDFEVAAHAADKVAEELAEVRAAAVASPGAGPTPEVFEEVGDLLFAAANLARKLNVDAEAALRAANAKFERRFRGMEALAAGAGTPLEDLDLEAQERLWQEVKRR
ncbi:MAG: nucleoside triphosphate pyrophosphohydrolase [Steroidobacterales bacterium]